MTGKRLTMAQRRALPKSDFLVPSKAPGPGSFPVPDRAHAQAAIGLSGNAANPSRVKAGAKRVIKQGPPAKANKRGGRK